MTQRVISKKKIVEEYALPANNNIWVTTTGIYIDGAVFETRIDNDVNTPDYTDRLLTIGQEEGRIRFKPSETSNGGTFEYDYFIKDHLENVRMVLTDEQQTIFYPAATLEGTYTTSSPQANSMVNYEKQFYNIDPTKIVSENTATNWSPESGTSKQYYNHNGNPPANLSYPSGCSPVQTDQSNNLYMLNGTTNRTGLEYVIKVMAGDKFDIFGKSYYVNTSNITNGNSTTLDLPTLLANFLLGPTNPAGGKGFNASQLNTINSPVFPGTFFRGNNNEPTTTIPKAYINYVLFDEQFKYYSGNFSRVGSVSGDVKDHWQIDPQLRDISVTKNGYLFVYVSNESNLPVYFDNLQVIHKPGSLIEETHYYPFGLAMAAISTRATNSISNKIKYNGKELANQEFKDGSGLEWYEYGMREYDHQLSRFFRIDPLAEKFSFFTPYQYASNNPIVNVDFDGAEGWSVLLQEIIKSANWYNYMGTDGTAFAKDIGGQLARTYVNEIAIPVTVMVAFEVVGNWLGMVDEVAMFQRLFRRGMSQGLSDGLSEGYIRQWTINWNGKIGDIPVPDQVMGQIRQVEANVEMFAARRAEEQAMRANLARQNVQTSRRIWNQTNDLINQNASYVHTMAEESELGGQIRQTLFHFTNKAGYEGIMSSQAIRPSTGWTNARYGDGVYLTDINQGEFTIYQGSNRLYGGTPWKWRNLTHYVEIDVSGLNVIKNPVPFNFVVPTSQPLPIGGRIVSHGDSWWSLIKK